MNSTPILGDQSKASRWGAPDSWDLPISYFRQQHRDHQALSHLKKIPKIICVDSHGNIISAKQNGIEPAKYAPQGIPKSGIIPPPNFSGAYIPPPKPSVVILSPNYEFAMNGSNVWPMPAHLLKGDVFFKCLKKKCISEDVILILQTEGINSLKILRQCSHDELLAKGIAQAQVIQLKKL